MKADVFRPNFEKGINGLLPVVVQDIMTKQVLMLAWVNEEPWRCTLGTGTAHYFSRSRQGLWLKGETSGNIQKVSNVLLDCDGDALVYLVEQAGEGACHTGARSCFFRSYLANRMPLMPFDRNKLKEGDVLPSVQMDVSLDLLSRIA